MASLRAPILVLPFLALSLHAAPAPPPPLSDLVARAGTYVLQFEERFATVISVEQYEQHARGRSYLAPVDRKIASEMLFLWLANERAWLAVRNVLAVNGNAVGDSEQRLDRLLAGAAPVGIARLRRLRDESARFNLGSIRRTFNDPMLMLRFFEPNSQGRFKFDIQGQETLDGSPRWKVAFDETATPTVIQDRGRNRPSHGMAWVAADGTIARTRLEVGDRLLGYTASIVVNYRPDAKLEMLVPAAMHETYMQITTADTSGPLGPVSERIECEATYTNFRRFETAARIVPEP